MGFTDKYEFEELLYGVAGWNSLITANFQALDEFLQTYIPGTAGEALTARQAVYLASDGKFYKAQANADSTMPSLGLVIADASAGGAILVRRVGPITDAGWSWSAGASIYVSDSVAGGLTATKPASRAQPLGVASAADTIFLNVTLIAL